MAYQEQTLDDDEGMLGDEDVSLIFFIKFNFCRLVTVEKSSI